MSTGAVLPNVCRDISQLLRAWRFSHKFGDWDEEQHGRFSEALIIQIGNTESTEYCTLGGEAFR